MGDGSSWFIILFLLLCAAYFAVAETAFASVNKIRIKMRADRGERRAKRAMYVLDNFERAITTILIGTNITHIVSAAIVTIIVTNTWGLSYVSISTVITTIVVFFVGEMLPKSIGKKYSERFSLSLAGSLCFFMLIFAPGAKILTAIGNFAASLTSGDDEVAVTEDELYDIIETMKDDGELEAEQGDLVHSALVFDDMTAENILTSRIDVSAIDIEDSPQEILTFIKSQRHSRMPVYRDSIDNIVGILQIRKYIKAWLKDGDNVDISSLLDEPYFVHQSTNIDNLLKEMSQRKINLAIVTDNYGGTCGIVTVEDILEELVGEIWDEDDVVEEPFVKISENTYEVDAELDIEELFDLISFEDPEETQWDHKSIGAWAYEEFVRIPKENEKFTYHNLEITATRIRKHRILKLLVRVNEIVEGGEEE